MSLIVRINYEIQHNYSEELLLVKLICYVSRAKLRWSHVSPKNNIKLKLAKAVTNEWFEN